MSAKRKRDHISFSQIDQYCKCGIKYFLYYEEGIVIPSSTSLVLGTTYHKALEVNHTQKIESGTDLPLSDLQECSANGIEEAFKEDILLSEDEKHKGKIGARDLLIHRSDAALKAYREELALNIQPLEVEKYFKIPLEDDLPPLVVVIDLITQDMRVVDNKTSSKKPPENVADESIQLSAYALAFKNQYGMVPTGLELQHTVVTAKTLSATTVTTKTTRTDEQLDHFKLRLQMVVDGIRKRVAIPPSQGDWQCKSCGYRELNYCPLYKRKVPVEEIPSYGSLLGQGSSRVQLPAEWF